MTPLAELFPDGDYRFHLTLRRGEPGDFFKTRDGSGRILAERAKWLAENPARYAAVLPEGEPLLAEVAELGEKEWGMPKTDTVHGSALCWSRTFCCSHPMPAGRVGCAAAHCVFRRDGRWRRNSGTPSISAMGSYRG